MREAGDYFQDWGLWGWLWPVGVYAFLLGLLLAPLALASQAPVALAFLALPGAVLMRASARFAKGGPRLETNI